ncbi:MAG: hypothetical protein HY676_05260 [Chloroflexi bacterium]|nr:hypothetical protein [Chloroflexota bacterium]
MPRSARRAKGGARQKSRGAGQASRRGRQNWLNVAYVVFALSLVGIMVFFLAINPASPSPGPSPSPSPLLSRPGDHWHASYAITICGTPVPQFPDDTSGIGIHTHGDGQIHIEPERAADAGYNANLARFMTSTGGTLTEDTLQLPDGRKYTNSDLCPDGRPGQVGLLVNGHEVRPIASYVPQNGDNIALSFAPLP